MAKLDNISWTAPEFIVYEKNSRWYTILLVLGIVLLAYSVLRKDYMMFVTFFLILVAVYLYSKRHPQELKITISGGGITVNDQRYPYSMIKSFWIIYQPPEVKTLTLETTNYINREVVLQIEDADPSEIRRVLIKYIPEDLNKEEAYTDRLARKLKF